MKCIVRDKGIEGERRDMKKQKENQAIYVLISQKYGTSSCFILSEMIATKLKFTDVGDTT